MQVYLLDGTYELFRHFYALPRAKDRDGQEVGAVRGVLGSVLGMLRGGATHLGVATDHVIESFRNRLWPGYKTGEGIDPELASQFAPLEEALVALGLRVWPMVDWEADDALAAAAARAEADPRVEKVFVCTPDKDLAQCVRANRVVQLDRRRKEERNEDGVLAKFGVGPRSIPDYLALVGDKADGYPGLPGWGARSAAILLRRYGHLEAIPLNFREWDVSVASPVSLAGTLRQNFEQALLFRDLATLRTDVPVFDSVDDLYWSGPTAAFEAIGTRLDAAKTEKGSGAGAARSRRASSTST